MSPRKLPNFYKYSDIKYVFFFKFCIKYFMIGNPLAQFSHKSKCIKSRLYQKYTNGVRLGRIMINKKKIGLFFLMFLKAYNIVSFV